MSDPMRVWQRDGFNLELYDTGIHRNGRWYVAYKFYDRGRLIFEGDDFSPGAGQSVDSDEAVFGLLGFLSVQPGDTDSEYFLSYTDEQMEWCQSGRAEALVLYVSDFEDLSYYQEHNGDYLIASNGGDRPIRRAKTEGDPTSVQDRESYPEDREIIRGCRPIRRSDVPAEWLRCLDPENFDPEFYGLD